MKRILKSEKLLISFAVIIPLLIVIGIFVSNYPLFYLSEVTVDRVEFTHYEVQQLDEYDRQEFFKALSTMNVGKRTKYETKIATSDGGEVHNIRVKLCFNKSVYVRVNTTNMKEIVVNSKYVYECDKEIVKKIIDIVERTIKKNQY